MKLDLLKRGDGYMLIAPIITGKFQIPIRIYFFHLNSQLQYGIAKSYNIKRKITWGWYNIMKNPYCIQRAIFKIGDQERDYNKGIDRILEFDYMGSSEFEWGALPQSLKKIREYISNKTSIIETVTIGTHKKSIKILYNTQKHTKEEIQNILENLAEGKTRLQEPSYFDICIYPERHPSFTSLQCDFWWDIDQDWMFWKDNKKFEKCFIELLKL